MADQDVQSVLKDRGAVYGPFHDNAVIAQALKDVFRSAPGWPKLNASQQEALDLKAIKMARILSGDPDYVDNWQDDAGYSSLIVKELNERKGT